MGSSLQLTCYSRGLNTANYTMVSSVRYYFRKLYSCSDDMRPGIVRACKK